MPKRNLQSTAQQKERMINTMEANYGNIRKAARTIGISPQTHYKWIKEDIAYEKQAESIKDIGYRNIKDNLIELAMKKAEKGDSAVLMKMMGIFLKNLPEEMQVLNRYNNAPVRVGIKYVDKPLNWNREDYPKPELGNE